MSRAVPVRETRVRSSRTNAGLRVDIARRRPWYRWIAPLWIAGVMTFGLVGMLTGEPPENSGGNWFLVLWAAIGIGCTSVALWGLLFREYVVVGPQAMTHARGLGPFWRRRDYHRTAVEDVRLGERTDTMHHWRSLGIGSGAVAFDYGDRTLHIADVDDAEAKRVVAALRAELGQA